ncbi:MAG: hypothetical protein HZY74_01055 [Brevundimonas sp.]|nr:MAG: hypothetical protein HZY74_01055 [Brevundimonas sp.]
MSTAACVTLGALALSACQPSAPTPEAPAADASARPASAEAPAASTQPCLADGERIEGRMSHGSALDENGEQLYTNVLVLDQPRCVGDGTVSGTRVRLNPADGMDFETLPYNGRAAITAGHYVAPDAPGPLGTLWLRTPVAKPLRSR